MRRVALLGGASSTRDGIQTSEADEVWTLNWSYLYDWVPRIDRLFEMHPVWLYAATDNDEWAKPRRHWEYLHQELPYPVYMLRDLPEIPSCIRYPIEEVIGDLFGYFLARGGKAKPFFTSSFDYCMALAIYERWDCIELYGFEMGSDTEYRYQREGAGFWIGQAVARGIRVELPGDTVLLKSRLYGYEGGQMIFRQDLERIKDQWERKHRDAVALTQYYEGRMSENPTEENRVKLHEARDTALVAHGGLELVRYQIKFIDLEEVEPELTQPFAMIPVKG